MTTPVVPADLAVRDLAISIEWYADLLGRAPDALSADAHAEWRHGADAGMRLVRDLHRAGSGALTVRMVGIGARGERIVGLRPGMPEMPVAGYLARLRDPDGNLVLLAG